MDGLEDVFFFRKPRPESKKNFPLGATYVKLPGGGGGVNGATYVIGQHMMI